MRRAILILLFHVGCSSPMGGACGAIDAEQEAQNLAGDVLLQASEHTLDEFIKACMWDKKYRSMDPDHRKKIVAHLRVLIARHLVQASAQELNRVTNVQPIPMSATPDHCYELDDIVLVQEADNDSGQAMYPPGGSAELDDF